MVGAAGQLGTYLCHFIALGKMFGPNERIILHLVEIPRAIKALKGLAMELTDSGGSS